MNPCPMYDSSIDSKKKNNLKSVKKFVKLKGIDLALYLKMLKLGKLGE